MWKYLASTVPFLESLFSPNFYFFTYPSLTFLCMYGILGIITHLVRFYCRIIARHKSNVWDAQDLDARPRPGTRNPFLILVRGQGLAQWPTVSASHWGPRSRTNPECLGLRCDNITKTCALHRHQSLTSLECLFLSQGSFPRHHSWWHCAVVAPQRRIAFILGSFFSVPSPTYSVDRVDAAL